MSPVPFIPGMVLDASHWQGLLDHEAMYAAGVRTVRWKLSEGRTFGDPLGGYNARMWQSVGEDARREFYHFWIAKDALGRAQDGREAMRYFRAALLGVYWQDGEPIYLDCESRSAPRVGVRYSLRNLFLTTYRAALGLGLLIDIYTRMEWWRYWIGEIQWAALGLPVPRLWAADYGHDRLGGGIGGPRGLYASWPARSWQFTDRGVCLGVPGFVDLSRELP